MFPLWLVETQNIPLCSGACSVCFFLVFYSCTLVSFLPCMCRIHTQLKRPTKKHVLISDVLSSWSSLSPPTFCCVNYSHLTSPWSQLCLSISQRPPALVGFLLPAPHPGNTLKTARWQKCPAHDICFPSFVALLYCLLSNIWTPLFDIFQDEMINPVRYSILTESRSWEHEYFNILHDKRGGTSKVLCHILKDNASRKSTPIVRDAWRTILPRRDSTLSQWNHLESFSFLFFFLF